MVPIRATIILISFVLKVVRVKKAMLSHKMKKAGIEVPKEVNNPKTNREKMPSKGALVLMLK